MRTTPAGKNPPSDEMGLGRRRLWPAVVVGAVLVLSYLAGHRVRDGLDLLASTVAAVGLLALSVALPRTVRAIILRGPRMSFDRASFQHGRRLLAIAASISVSALAVWVSALLAASLPVERSAHAVTLVVAGFNAWLLLSNLLTAPPLGGWLLVLAVVDGVGTPPHQRLAHARRLGRTGVLAVAILLAAWSLTIGHVMLVFAAIALAWYGWIATAVAEIDDAISRFVDGRRVGDLLRPTLTQFDEDRPVSEVTARRHLNEVALVFGAGGLAGAIGPRQVAGLSDGREALRCKQVMVPMRELSIVSATAPAANLLPHLGRHGFVVARAGAGFGYVEEHDLLQRIVIATDVRQRVADDDGRSAAGGS